MSSQESESDVVADLSNPDVTTKYMCAAGIANAALAMAIEKSVADVDIHDLCNLVDAFIVEETGKMYNKKGKAAKVEKGIAFPTCVSVNEVCGHFSPMKGESSVLKAGDLAKIDLGVHIDGFVSHVGHTIVVGGAAVSGPAADAVHAAWTTAECALRLIKVGNTNTQVTQVIKKCADEFGCNPVQGVLSHQVKKHVIDCNQAIVNCETVDEKVEEFTFGMNEVYNVDVLVSSGEGKPKETEIRTTVFKRALENTYTLKTQKARQFLSEIGRTCPTLPFSLRAFDETVARVGVTEATRHELLHSYPVLTEKPGQFVAGFKYTVLLLPGGTKKVTGIKFDPAAFTTEKTVKDEELDKLLKTSANPKKAKKKKAAEAKAE